MEGIEDGQAVDDCFYCLLLYPDLYLEKETCPQCGNRFHYRPASITSMQILAIEHRKLAANFLAAPTKAHAKELLRFLHCHQEQLATELSPSLQALKKAFGRL